MAEQGARELARAINVALNNYIEVRNSVFNQPWWRSLPIPGLFKPIAFDRLEVKLDAVIAFLSETEDRIRNTVQRATGTEQDFLAALHQYTRALIDAVIALKWALSHLSAKAAGRTYSATEYARDLKTYKEAERIYVVLGMDMNRAWQEFVTR